MESNVSYWLWIAHITYKNKKYCRHVWTKLFAKIWINILTIRFVIFIPKTWSSLFFLQRKRFRNTVCFGKKKWIVENSEKERVLGFFNFLSSFLSAKTYGNYWLKFYIWASTDRKLIFKRKPVKPVLFLVTLSVEPLEKNILIILLLGFWDAC